MTLPRRNRLSNLLAVCLVAISSTATAELCRAVGPLDPALIPIEDRLVDQPKALVAVLGSQRARAWGEGRSVAFSPDGKTLASGGDDGHVRLWDATTLRDKGILRGHRDQVFCVAFSSDSKRLVSCGEDSTVRVWDLTVSPPLQVVSYKRHEGAVNRVAFTSDGKCIVSAGDDETVRIWDASGERSTPPAVLAHDDQVRALALAPGGKTLVSGAGDNVYVWDLTAIPPKEIARVEIPRQRLQSLSFAPDGTRFASAGSDRKVRIWDATGTTPKVLSELSGHIDVIFSVAYSADGKTLASGDWKGQVHIWNASEKEPVESTVLTTLQLPVHDLSFSPDHRSLAGASWNPSIQVWDLTAKPIEARLKSTGHTDEVRSVAFGPSGDTLATASWDKTVRIWDLTGSKPIEKHVLEGLPHSVNAVAFTPDGKRLVTGCRLGSLDSTLFLWTLDTKPPTSAPIKAIPISDVDHLAISPDGKLLASDSIRNADLFHLDTAGAKPFAKLESTTGPMAFSADGKKLAWASLNKVRLWDLTGKPLLIAETKAGEDLVTSLVFGPDGKTLHAASQDRTIRVWSIGAGGFKPIKVLKHHRDAVTSLVISADGKRLVSAGYDGRVVVWNTDLWSVQREWLLSGAVLQLAFAPGDRYLATANKNGTSYIFDTEIK